MKPKAELTEAERATKRVKRLVRKGVYPRRLFARGRDGKLERAAPNKKYAHGKLTWRTIDVVAFFKGE